MFFRLLVILTFSRVTRHEDEPHKFKTTPPCSNGDVYASLNECARECRNDAYNDDISQSGEKFRYKVLTLSTNDVTISASGLLVAHLPSLELATSDYALLNSTARICYPLDQNFINCDKWPLEPDEFVLSNDSRHLWLTAYNATLPFDQFFTIEVDDDDDDDALAVVCVSPSAVAHRDALAAVDKWFLAVHALSAISLVVTLACCVRFPALNVRRNYHLLCHMSVMSVAYWTLVIEHFTRQSQTPPAACLAIAFVKQFAFLATFFWINVQAIDLYLRFHTTRVNSSTATNERRFVYYSAYAWGCPLTVSCVTLGMAMSDASPSIRPDWRTFCWFDAKFQLTALIYFYALIAVILVVNIALFSLTIWKLYSVGKIVAKVNDQIHKQLLQLCVKLFVITGLCWIMEVISWAAGGEEKHWYFTDAINGLQGVFILVIYLCKPKFLRKMLGSKYWFTKWGNRRTSAVQQKECSSTTSAQTSQTSQTAV